MILNAYWKVAQRFAPGGGLPAAESTPLMGILRRNHHVLSQEPLRNVDQWSDLIIRSAGGVTDFRLEAVGPQQSMTEARVAASRALATAYEEKYGP